MVVFFKAIFTFYLIRKLKIIIFLLNIFASKPLFAKPFERKDFLIIISHLECKCSSSFVIYTHHNLQATRMKDILLNNNSCRERKENIYTICLKIKYSHCGVRT